MTKKDIANSKDTTLERNSTKHWEFLISEYLLIKDKKHSRFAFVQEFYDFYNIKRQNFIKYYNRYKLAKLNKCNIDEIRESLLPSKRGPKYLYNRTKVSDEITNKIKELRVNNGMNKYNIKKELEILFNNKINSVDKIPSSSTIYNILKLNNLNKLNTEARSRGDVCLHNITNEWL